MDNEGRIWIVNKLQIVLNNDRDKSEKKQIQMITTTTAARIDRNISNSTTHNIYAYKYKYISSLYKIFFWRIWI